MSDNPPASNGTEPKSTAESSDPSPPSSNSSSSPSKSQPSSTNNTNGEEKNKPKAANSDGEATQEATQEPPKEKPLWGRLVSLNPKFKNVELRDEEVVVGRSANCQVVIDSLNVSGKHCIISRQKTEYPAKGGAEKRIDYTVLVKDTSTNGTFVNNDAVGKNNTKLLYDGCEISLLPKKSSTDKIAFIFNDCHKEMQEQEQGGPQGVYEMKKELGTGTFASVRLAVHRTTGEEVAIKVINKEKFLQKAKRKDALMDEVRVLTSVSHPNILQIRGVFETPKVLYLVLELATGGELFDRVVKGAQPEPTACEIFYQILLAIKYLHAQGIAHRDLKPENILLQSPDSNTIKISDFGLSRIIDEGTYMRTVCGTPQYVAPEILTKAEKEGYGKAVDMWSLGVILFVLLGGYAPFDDDPKANKPLFEKVKKADYSFDPKYWKKITEQAKDLIRNLLVVDPSKRLTAEQALAHPWIAMYKDKFLPPDSAAPTTDSTSTSAPTSTSTSSSSTATPSASTPTKTTESKPAAEDIIFSPLPISARRKRNKKDSDSTSTPKKRKIDDVKAKEEEEEEEDESATKKSKKAKKAPAKGKKATPKRR